MNAPVITTLSQTKTFFENGYITITGTCQDVEQFILCYRNSTELPFNVYHHVSGTSFSITGIPFVSGNNIFKLVSYEITTNSVDSNSITVIGVNNKVTVNNNFTLANVSESMFQRLITDTVLHSGLTALAGKLPKIYLGIDEMNYPEDDFYIAITLDNKSLGETQPTNEIKIPIGIVLKDSLVSKDTSDPDALIEYEKMNGLLILDQIGELVKRHLSYEAQKHNSALDDVDYNIQRIESFPAFVCNFTINITQMVTIGNNGEYYW
jgi:hypothetical protein